MAGGRIFTKRLSNTGAWGWYAAARLGLIVPGLTLRVMSECQSLAPPVIPGSAISLRSSADALPAVG